MWSIAGQNNFYIRPCIKLNNLTFTDRLAILIRDRRVGAILLSSVLIVALSYYRAYTVGTIRVDLFGLSGLPVIIVFTGFIIGLTVYSLSFYWLWDAGDLG